MRVLFPTVFANGGRGRARPEARPLFKSKPLQTGERGGGGCLHPLFFLLAETFMASIEFQEFLSIKSPYCLPFSRRKQFLLYKTCISCMFNGITSVSLKLLSENLYFLCISEELFPLNVRRKQHLFPQIQCSNRKTFTSSIFHGKTSPYCECLLGNAVSCVS